MIYLFIPQNILHQLSRHIKHRFLFQSIVHSVIDANGLFSKRGETSNVVLGKTTETCLSERTSQQMAKDTTSCPWLSGRVSEPTLKHHRKALCPTLHLNNCLTSIVMPPPHFSSRSKRSNFPYVFICNKKQCGDGPFFTKPHFMEQCL